MSNTLPTTPGAPVLRTDGVLASRLGAYIVDLVMIGVWTLFFAFIIAVIGVITLGLGWYLFALLPATGVLYSAFTVGGSKQATVGMRLFGLKVVRVEGGRVDWLTAAAHSLFFYVAASTGLLLAIDILVGLIHQDRRFLHDLLTGLAVVRSDG